MNFEGCWGLYPFGGRDALLQFVNAAQVRAAVPDVEEGSLLVVFADGSEVKYGLPDDLRAALTRAPTPREGPAE